MSENRRARQSSGQIRASLVDSGWSENPGPPSDPPPSSPPDVKTRQISAEELAELVRSAESAPIDPSEPRDLPRYDAAPAVSDEPERQIEDLVPPEERTKRIPYAALLGGSQAGRGGPSRPAPAPPPPPSPVAKEDALDSFDAGSQPLPSFPRADSRPDAQRESGARASLDSEPLPAFSHAAPLPPARKGEGSPFGDDGPTVVHRLGPTLKPSRPPAPAAPRVEPEAQPEPKPKPEAPPAPAELAPEPPEAPAAVAPSPVVPDFDIANAVEAERGLFAALGQRFRFLGMRLPVWLVIPVIALAVAAPMHFLSKAPSAQRPPAPLPSSAPPAKAPAPAPEPKKDAGDVHSQAAQGQIEAMERLKQIPELERSSEDAVALARGEAAQRLEALEPLTERLAKEPDALEDAEFRHDFLEFVVDRNTYVEALAALARVPTKLGPDLLYEIWTGTKKSNEVTRLAKDLVYAKDVRSRASDALGVALDLRAAEDCPANREAVKRALDFGDRRSVHLLGRLLGTRGCGPDKADDCYPCLRDASRVEQAVEAVRNRKAPLL